MNLSQENFTHPSSELVMIKTWNEIKSREGLKKVSESPANEALSFGTQCSDTKCYSTPRQKSQRKEPHFDCGSGSIEMSLLTVWHHPLLF